MPRDGYQIANEVAARLRRAEASLYHWVRLSDRRAICIGKGRRIAVADSTALLLAHETSPEHLRAAALSRFY